MISVSVGLDSGWNLDFPTYPTSRGGQLPGRAFGPTTPWRLVFFFLATCLPVGLSPKTGVLTGSVHVTKRRSLSFILNGELRNMIIVVIISLAVAFPIENFSMSWWFPSHKLSVNLSLTLGICRSSFVFFFRLNKPKHMFAGILDRLSSATTH